MMYEDLEIPSFLREAALKPRTPITPKHKPVEKIDISRFYNLKEPTASSMPRTTQKEVVVESNSSDSKVGQELLAKMKKSDAIRHLGAQNWPIKRIMAALGITYQHVYVTLKNVKK